MAESKSTTAWAAPWDYRAARRALQAAILEANVAAVRKANREVDETNA